MISLHIFEYLAIGQASRQAVIKAGNGYLHNFETIFTLFFKIFHTFFQLFTQKSRFSNTFFQVFNTIFQVFNTVFQVLTQFFKFSTQKSSLPLTNLVIHTLIKFANTTFKILRLYGPHKCFEPKCEIAFDHEGNVLFTVWCTHEYIKL